MALCLPSVLSEVQYPPVRVPMLLYDIQRVRASGHIRSKTLLPSFEGPEVLLPQVSYTVLLTPCDDLQAGEFESTS